MNRLQNAQKKLAESLTALESAVKQAQHSTALITAGNVAGTADSDISDVPKHLSSAIDTEQLSQDLAVIEADLEKAMKMIADLMVSGLSPGRDKNSI
tara:strand:- start:246 stop:536 length:291 start_codon:yes stop_codon:yes gene_type:complete